jgi:predicted nucleic acid-binding Zn ribbon protein
MERAARLIGKNELLSDVDFARAVWPLAVGKAIAAHTSRIRLVRSTLVVEVEDAIWQKQLYGLTSQIVERFRKITGKDTVRDLEFRIAIPRRPAQRAEVPELRRSNDEAEQIIDPVLKKIYRRSRKRATG